MDLETLALIQNHGYWIISLAVIFFDIPTALGAGYLIGRGQLHFLPSVLALLAGRLSLEIILFSLGRYRLQSLVKLWPPLEELANRGGRLIKKHPVIIMSLYHFIVGTKLAVPLGGGLSREHIKIRSFFFYNTIGLIIWIVVMLTAGISLAISFS